MRTGRWVVLALGGLVVVVGMVWVGQGLGLIPGSFMTGDRTWFGIGLLVAVAGLLAIVLALRRPPPGSGRLDGPRN